jgi:hypothetical protein
MADRKFVIVRETFELMVSVPADWDGDMVNFHRNESSWCSSNVAAEIEEQQEEGRCNVCVQHTSEFLREATPHDIELRGRAPLVAK